MKKFEFKAGKYNRNVFFIIPCFLISSPYYETNDWYSIEIAWLKWGIGVKIIKNNGQGK